MRTASHVMIGTCLTALMGFGSAFGVARTQGTVPRPTIRDSAGVRIVEYRSLRSGVPSIRIEPPYLALGGTRSTEDEELDPRQPWLSATELTNGTIVVNEFTQLKFFDRSGRFVRVVGRRGSGPGEFNQTREICKLKGDTLLVIDASSGRLTLWDSAGRHVRTVVRPGFISDERLSARRHDHPASARRISSQWGTSSTWVPEGRTRSA